MESEYTLVSVRNTCGNVWENYNDIVVQFETAVTAKLREGWTLVGGVSFTTWGEEGIFCRLTQALTRKKKTD
jgi:hypothetical protein